MILLTEPFGNHSNRLFQAAHIEAWCLENHKSFHNLCFKDMEKLYDMKKKWNTKLLILLNKLNLLKFVPEIDLERCDGKIDFPKKTIRVRGWAFNESNELTEKYRPYFQRKYSLRSCIVNSNSFISSFQNVKKDNVVVGIHIRRGDYKVWCDGKYYYDDIVYTKCINLMKKLLTGKKCKFIVFSNEDVRIDGDDIIVSKNDWYIDQYIMGKCDYLIGPPSTFTLWASYLGEVPCCHIQSECITFSLEDFVVCGG